MAPRLLDPVLAVVERVDRARRRIVPARQAALLGVERNHHHGQPVTLADGTIVTPGDRVDIIHFDNACLSRLGTAGWQRAAYEVARQDLRALAVRHARLPDAERPVAYTGVTILAPLARRAGFEVRERPRTSRARLEDWYLRSLLARWAPGGRQRLARGRRELRTLEVWMSGAELLRRYSPPPE